jgi:enoyl-CoA hydratase/carnithine racemase
MTVERERRGHTLVITLQREEKRNAIDTATAEGIDAAMDELEGDAEVWVGILTGTTTVFSAGTDLREPRSPATANGGEYGVIRRRRAKPLIAAVEGPALGGGFEIVLACDLVVAARTARFGLPEVKIGLIPACGGLFRPGRALPLNLAKELILTGDPIDAERAAAAGLVNVVTEPGGALAGALDLAERICINAPVAVRESLRAFNRVVEADDPEGWAATEEVYGIVRATSDAAEGRRSFFERRPPAWQGR